MLDDGEDELEGLCGVDVGGSPLDGRKLFSGTAVVSDCIARVASQDFDDWTERRKKLFLVRN